MNFVPCLILYQRKTSSKILNTISERFATVRLSYRPFPAWYLSFLAGYQFLFKKSDLYLTFFSLYVLFSHFTPRDVTREICFFQLSSHFRVSTWICMHNLWKDKRHIPLRTSCVLNWESKTSVLKRSIGHLHDHFTTTATKIYSFFLSYLNLVIPVRLKSPNLHKKVKLWRILVVVVVKRSHRTNRLYKHGTILPFFGLGFLSVFYSVRFVHYHANCFRPQYHSKNVAFRRNHWRQITLFPECLARH